jgi:type IV secretory pathway component VirB8
MSTWNSIADDVQKLAEALVKQFVNQAVADARQFVEDTEKDVAEWTALLASKQITQKNFESLVRGQHDLADMKLLKQKALGKVTLDTFVNGVLQIVIDAALASIP